MPTELKITQLRHFVLVAELKSFHTASKKACRSQPAISLSIMELEKKIDDDLFIRNKSSCKNSIKLTEAGKYLLPKAKRILAYHDNITRDIERTKHSKKNEKEKETFTIASIPSVSQTLLPQTLKRFIAENKDTTVNVYDYNSHLIVKMLDDKEIDIGIAQTTQDISDETKIWIPLYKDEIGVICHKNHPLSKNKSLSWKDLTPFNYIKNDTTGLLLNTEAKPLINASSISLFNTSSLISMLESGYGITTLPLSAVPKDIKSLIFIPLTKPQIIRTISIVKPATTEKKEKTQRFIEIIKNNIK